MIIETERLRLRPFHTHEAGRLRELINNWDAVLKWLVAAPYPYSLADAEKWIGEVNARHETGRPLSFAFALKETDELMGCGGLDGVLRNLGHGEIALGYWLGNTYRGKGFATEIMREMLRYGFHDLGLTAIYAHADPSNEPSQNVMRKIGMSFMGMVEVNPPTRATGSTQMPEFRITREEYI